MRLAIIGGGPAGLITAYFLKRDGVRVDITLFEATSRLGGKVVTREFDSAPVAYEAGAAELYDYSMVGPDPLRELVRELGLTTRPLDGRTVVLDHRPLQTDDDIRRYLGQRAFDALEGFRRRAKSLINPRDYYESDWKENSQDPLARQSFHDLLMSVPDESARRYIRVAVHCDLATEPHQTNALYGLHNFLMNEPSYMRLYTIDGGIESLTRELAERISGRVLLGHRVISVEKTRQGTYRVRARRGDEILSHEFDIVVVALPNNWIPAIEWRGEALSKAMHAHHVRYDYPAHYLRVSMLFKEAFWREQINESYFMLDSFGGCCVYDETSRRDNVPFGVLGFLVAGEAALNLSNFDDASLIEQMLESLPPGLGDSREMLLEGRVHRWAGSVNGLPSGNPPREPGSRHVPEPEENPRLLVVGDYLFDSTLNGVLDSAEVAVEFILKEIRESINVRALPVRPASPPLPGKPAPPKVVMMPGPATNLEPPESLESIAQNQALRVSHFRFAPDAQAGESVRRRFTQPRSMVAIEQPAELSSLSPALSMVKPWPETLDDLHVVLASTPLTSEARSKIDSWLAAPDHPDARPLVVQLDAGTVRWRPGRAAAEGTVDVCKSLVVALVDFSFFEGELRRLEQELLSYEASASEDVAFAYQVGQAGRTEWKRLGQTMVSISRLRLTFARLEPALRAVSPSLPPDARKAITRLIAGADVPSRLEAFDSRLEVCEDLYEGAVDRIADFRWYRNGERLEIAIVVLLVLEVILSAWGLRLR